MIGLICQRNKLGVRFLRSSVPRRNYIKTSSTVNKIIQTTKARNKDPEIRDCPMIVKRINETGGNLTIVELLELKKKEFEATSLKSLKSEAVLKNLMVNISPRLYNNSSLHVFLVNELKALIPKDKELFKTTLRTLCEKNRFIRSIQQKITTLRTSGLDEISLQYSYFRILILLCLTLSNPILASALLLKNTEYTIRNSLVQQVINALLLKNPKYDEYDLDLAMKLSEKFQFKFTEFQASQILVKLEVSSNIILTKKFQDYLLFNTSFNTRNAKINHYYELIQNDFRMKNISGVYINWKVIHKEYDNITEHDVRILSVLIQAFNRSKQYIKLSKEIIHQLPPEYFSNPLLTTHLIYYCGKTRDIKLANNIIKELRAPLHRDVLSALLRLNLIIQDMTGMEKILNQILDTYKTLNAHENEIIVKGLLKQGKFEQALVFADGMDPKVGSSSYLEIIDHLITTRGKTLEPEHLVIIDKFVGKISDLNNPKESFWGMISSLYFKHITRSPTTEDLEKAKTIYENSIKNFINRAYRPPLKHSKIEGMTINPFKAAYKDEVVLLIPESTRIIIVKTILDQAIKIKDTKILNWCCFELFELGLSPLAIKIDISRKMNSSLGQIGISSDETMRKFVSSWESSSIKFLQKTKALKKLRS